MANMEKCLIIKDKFSCTSRQTYSDDLFSDISRITEDNGLNRITKIIDLSL